jgi:hypothetical protein
VITTRLKRTPGWRGEGVQGIVKPRAEKPATCVPKAADSAEKVPRRC